MHLQKLERLVAWSQPISIFEIIVSGDTLPVISYLAGRRLASHRSPHNLLVNKFRDFDCHFLQPSGRDGQIVDYGLLDGSCDVSSALASRIWAQPPDSDAEATRILISTRYRVGSPKPLMGGLISATKAENL